MTQFKVPSFAKVEYVRSTCMDLLFVYFSSAENSVTLSCDANNRKAVDQTSIWSLSEVSSRADRDTEQR